MDYELIKLVLTLVNMLVTAAIGVKVWLDSRQRVTVGMIKENDDKAGKRMERIENDIDRLEKDIAAWPSHEIIRRLHSRIDEIVAGTGDIKHSIGGLERGMEALGNQYETINTYLLNRSNNGR
jgi:archaellum component FlaC